MAGSAVVRCKSNQITAPGSGGDPFISPAYSQPRFRGECHLLGRTRPLDRTRPQHHRPSAPAQLPSAARTIALESQHQRRCRANPYSHARPPSPFQCGSNRGPPVQCTLNDTENASTEHPQNAPARLPGPPSAGGAVCHYWAQCSTSVPPKAYWQGILPPLPPPLPPHLKRGGTSAGHHPAPHHRPLPSPSALALGTDLPRTYAIDLPWHWVAAK
jgi:hypothetical protein